jgi:hypothetical protein
MTLAALLALPLTAPAVAATPAPQAPHQLPAPHYPKVPLHTEFVVEVNKLGQVVRVKSGKSCKDLNFNAKTYGNVLQMWIRHPDGTAEVGLYKVTYDYDPSTKAIHRGIALVKPGGDWADKRGAANDMMDIADKETRKAQQQQQQQQNLPSLQQIEHPSASPSPHA